MLVRVILGAAICSVIAGAALAHDMTADLKAALQIPEGAQQQQVPFSVAGDQLGVQIDDSELKWVPCGGEAYEKGGTFLAGCEAVVLRTDPDKGGLEMFVRTPASFVWPTHWHTNSEHLIGIEGVTPIHFEDGSVHDIAPGEFIYIPNGLIHSAYCTSDGPCSFFLRTDKASDFNILEK